MCNLKKSHLVVPHEQSKQNAHASIFLTDTGMSRLTDPT